MLSIPHGTVVGGCRYSAGRSDRQACPSRDQSRPPVTRLNPLLGIDADVVGVVLKGEFLIRGFRNREVRDLFFGITDDPVERRRRSGQVTRLLRLFADHGLIHKIAKTHRYQLTAEGRRLLPTFINA